MLRHYKERVAALAVGLLGGERFGLFAVGFFPGDDRVAKDTDFFDLAFHYVAGFEVQGFRIVGEGGYSGDGSGGNDIARAVAHGRIVGKNFGIFTDILPECERWRSYAVDAKLHIEIVSVGTSSGGDDPGAQRAEGVEALQKLEDAGLHFAALNVACGDVVENDVAPTYAEASSGVKCLPDFFRLQLARVRSRVPGEVLGINYRFFVADDGVYVLEEDDPGHYWRGRKPALLASS